MLPIAPILVELLLGFLQILTRLATLLVRVGFTELVAGLVHVCHIFTQFLSVAAVAMVLASTSAVTATLALMLASSLYCHQ